MEYGDSLYRDTLDFGPLSRVPQAPYPTVPAPQAPYPAVPTVPATPVPQGAPVFVPPAPAAPVAPQAPYTAPQAPHAAPQAPYAAPQAPYAAPTGPAPYQAPAGPAPYQAPAGAPAYSAPAGPRTDHRWLIVAAVALAAWWFWPYLSNIHVPIPDFGEQTTGRTIALQQPKALAKALRSGAQKIMDGSTLADADREIRKVHKDYANAIFEHSAVPRLKRIVKDGKDFESDGQRKQFAEELNKLADELDR